MCTGRLLLGAFLILLALCLAPFMGCAASGPQLGEVAKGAPIDKSGDAVLQDLIQTVRPKFAESEFTGQNGQKIGYWLFTPAELKPGEQYPLVLFMADASTAGRGDSALTQGYGALLWATPESQAKHPCFVLVPKFTGIAVSDAYERASEVDLVLELVNGLANAAQVDQSRLYATGQSMGGMISMYFASEHPEVFAACLFVDCHWDTGRLDKLVEQNFIYITAGDSGKSAACVQAIEKAARKFNRSYTTASWSAKLPQATQNELAATMLEKGAPINLFNFESGTVLPESGKGSEHMYSFDYAYKLTPVRDWLFKYSK